MSYESIGSADGVPILGLHDLLADRGQLRPLAAALPPDRFRLTLPDMRGHGASAMISGQAYPARELAADAVAILDAEGLGRAHVVGVGWSAGIALGLAALAPERVGSVVLVGPFLPALSDDAALRDTLHQAIDAAARGQTDRAIDLYLGVRWGASWPDTVTKTRLGAMRRAAGNLAPLLTGTFGSAFPEVNRIELQGPVKVIEPSPDAPRSLQTFNALTDVLGRARVERVSGEANGQDGESAWLMPVYHELQAFNET